MLIASIMHPALFVVLVIVVALVLFVTEAIPVPATAMLVSVSLYFSGIISAKEAVSGFSSDNAMIIAGLGIIGETLYRTGAASKIGTLIERVAKTERVFVFFLVLVTGALATCMSVGGSAALMISVALGISQSTSYRRCKLMYPIAVGVALGGGVTTVGSSSTLFLHELLADMGLEMRFFELAPISIFLLVVSALFLSTVGFNLMPDVPNNEDRFTFSGSKDDFSDVPKWKPAVALSVLGMTFLAMYFSSQLGLNVGMIAVTAAFVVIAIRLIPVKQAFGAIPMSVIVMYTFLTPPSLTPWRTPAPPRS